MTSINLLSSLVDDPSSRNSPPKNGNTPLSDNNAGQISLRIKSPKNRKYNGYLRKNSDSSDQTTTLSQKNKKRSPKKKKNQFYTSINLTVMDDDDQYFEEEEEKNRKTNPFDIACEEINDHFNKNRSQEREESLIANYDSIKEYISKIDTNCESITHLRDRYLTCDSHQGYQLIIDSLNDIMMNNSKHTRYFVFAIFSIVNKCTFLENKKL